MSGFETGVAVMPQIRAAGQEARVRGARKLLTTSATVMSLALLSSSVVCAVLIPAPEFEPGGHANGRALACLAHENLGNGFGSVYDVATILILWFAGASAMAGLLNIVPRYLPRYGMAPEWARLTRPLVVLFATVALSARRRGRRRAALGFAVVAVVFLYTTVVNIVERPEGVQVASLFILLIVGVSVVSRIARAFELRATDVTLDRAAARYVSEASHSGEGHRLVLIAHDPRRSEFEDYVAKEDIQRRINRLPDDVIPLFVEIELRDASDFATELDVRGVERSGHRVLVVTAPSIGNSMAAILLYLRDATGIVPDAYFKWFEGDPFANFLRFLFLGEGENAIVAQQVLWRAVPDPTERPRVHVG